MHRGPRRSSYTRYSQSPVFNLRTTFIFSRSKAGVIANEWPDRLWQKSPEIVARCHRWPKHPCKHRRLQRATCSRDNGKRTKLIKAVINERKSLSPRCCCHHGFPCVIFFCSRLLYSRPQFHYRKSYRRVYP